MTILHARLFSPTHCRLSLNCQGVGGPVRPPHPGRARAGRQGELSLLTAAIPVGSPCCCCWPGEAWLTAAVPVDSPYCSCKLTLHGALEQGEAWLTAAVPVDSPYCSCNLTLHGALEQGEARHGLQLQSLWIVPTAAVREWPLTPPRRRAMGLQLQSLWRVPTAAVS